MVYKKMTWTLNALAFGAVAMLIVLPDPFELRAAFDYGKEQRSIKIIETPKSVVVEAEPVLTASVQSVRIQSDQLEGCLEAADLKASAAITSCLPQAVQTIVNYDLAAERRKEAGYEVFPNPDIEQKRAEVIKLCRSRWSGQNMGENTPNIQACETVIQPVAY